MPGTPSTCRLVAVACAAALIGSAALAPVASADLPAGAASTATAKLRANDIGAKTRSAAKIRRVKVARTFYNCGQLHSRWFPGNLVSGVSQSAGRGKSWFASYPDQVRSWQKGRQNTRTRSAIRNLRAAYPTGVQRACAHLNPKPRVVRAKKSCAVSSSRVRPAGGLRLVSLKRKKALVACISRLVSRKGHSAGADTTDFLQVVAPDNTASSAVTRGSADISRTFHGPNGLEVLLFRSPAQISNDAADPKCWVAKVNPTTGVPTCLLDETTVTQFDLSDEATYAGYRSNPYVMFDASGNVYVTGGKSRSSEGSLFKIDSDGNVTDLLHSEGRICVSHVSVLPNGSAVLNESPVGLRRGQGCWDTTNLVKVSPSGVVTHLCDGPTQGQSELLSPDAPGEWQNKCSSGSYGITSDSSLLIGGIPTFYYDEADKFWHPLAYSIGLLATDATTTSTWLAHSYEAGLGGLDRPAPTHTYDDMGCGLWDHADACSPSTFDYASLLKNGSTVALMAVQGGGVGDSTYGEPPLLAELYPIPKILNLNDVKSPFLARSLNGTNAYAVAGINKAGGHATVEQMLNCAYNTRLAPADDKCGAKEQLSIYDREVNDDVPVDLPYDMGIYDMQSSGDGKTLYIAARRVSDGKYLIGQVDVATTALTITSESDTPLNSFTAF